MNEQLKLKKATYHLYTFFISKLIGSLGGGVYAFGISMYVLALTGSSFSFAMVMLCSILSRTIVSPFAGVIGDRVPRKLLVIGGQSGVVVTTILLLSYTMLVDLSMPAIYVATTLNAIFGTFSSIAFSSSISNLVDEERLQRAMSFNQMAMSIAGIGGPIVGGMLFGFVSMEVFLITYVVSSIIALCLESTMNFTLYKKESDTTEVVEEKKESMMESFKDGLRYIKTKPLLIALLYTSFGINFFFTALNVGGDFTLVTILKMPSEYIGFTEAAMAIGVILASIYFASAKQVKNPLLLSKYSILGMSTLVILTALPLFLNMNLLGNFIYFLVLMFIFGVTSIMTNMPIGVLFQTMIDDEYKSRVFSILEMVAMSLMPLAMLVYGILFDILPAQYIFIGSGLCLIALTLYTLRPSVIKFGTEETAKIRKATDAEKAESTATAKLEQAVNS